MHPQCQGAWPRCCGAIQADVEGSRPARTHSCGSCLQSVLPGALLPLALGWRLSVNGQLSPYPPCPLLGLPGHLPHGNRQLLTQLNVLASEGRPPSSRNVGDPGRGPGGPVPKLSSCRALSTAGALEKSRCPAQPEQPHENPCHQAPRLTDRHSELRITNRKTGRGTSKSRPGQPQGSLPAAPATRSKALADLCLPPSSVSPSVK